MFIAASLLIFACGSAGSDEDARADATADEIEITMAVMFSQELDSLVREWEKENTGVRVVMVERSHSDHHDYLQALLSGDETVAPADIAVVEEAAASRFTALADRFVDLRDFGAGEFAGDHLAWRWQSGVAPDGTVFGIPIDAGGLAVAYRTDLFAEAGLPTDRDEVSALWRTWDAFLETGTRFVDNSDAMFIDNERSLSGAVLRQLPSVWYPDLDGPDTDDLAEARRWGTRAAEAGLVFDEATFSDEWRLGLNNGEFAVLIAPTWMIAFLQENAPATEGLWDLAAVPGAGGSWGGSQLAIPASTEEPELAWSLLTYLLGAQGQLDSFEAYGHFPTIVSLFDAPAVRDATNPFFNDAPVGRIYGDAILAVGN